MTTSPASAPPTGPASSTPCRTDRGPLCRAVPGPAPGSGTARRTPAGSTATACAVRGGSPGPELPGVLGSPHLYRQGCLAGGVHGASEERVPKYGRMLVGAGLTAAGIWFVLRAADHHEPTVTLLMDEVRSSVPDAH